MIHDEYLFLLVGNRVNSRFRNGSFMGMGRDLDGRNEDYGTTSDASFEAVIAVLIYSCEE